ncbi:Ger(x)C family spore germination protein [Priestia aryabhattai]
MKNEKAMVKDLSILIFRRCLLLIVFFLCSCLTACSDYKEVNQISFVTGVAFDKVKDETYKATLQVINPANMATTNSSGGQGPAVLNYEGEGKTVGEAMWKSFEKLPRPASFPHLEVIVISEKIAKEGLLNVLDLFDREPEIRLSTIVAVSHHTSAHSILNALTPLNKVPSNSLVSTLENAKDAIGTGQTLNLSQTIQYIKDEGQEVAISTIGFPQKKEGTSHVSSLEKSSPTSPEIDGVALFKGDKWVTWREKQEMHAVLMAYNQMKAMYVTVPFQKHKFVTVRLLQVKSKKYTHMKDGIPYLKMKVKGIADIEEIKGSYTIETNRDLHPLEKSVEKELKKEINKMITFSQKYQTDTLGFGKQLSIQHPGQWQHYRTSWNSLYQRAHKDIDVDISIKTAGARTHSNKFQRGETR